MILPVFCRRGALKLQRIATSRGMLSLADQAVVSGTSFATSVVIGRLLAPESLGVFFLAWNLVMLARAAQGDLITSPYMMYFRRRTPEEAPQYTGSILGHELLFTLCCTLLVAAGIAAGRFQAQVPLNSAWYAIVAALPLLLMREFVRNLAFAHLEVRAVLLTDVAVAMMQLSGLALLAATGLLTVAATYITMAGACAVASLVWWHIRGPHWRVSWTALRSDWRTNWKFGRWALASQLTGRTAAFALPWIIAVVHGSAATGVLAACTTLVNMAGMFVTGISNYLTPRAAEAYARDSVPGLTRVLRRFAALYLTTIGGFTVAMFLWGGPCAALVFGSDYRGHGTVIALLAANMLLSSLSITVGNGLWALDCPRANFLADAGSLLTSLAVIPLLVRYYSVAGAAAALLAGTLCGTLIRAVMLRRQLENHSPPRAEVQYA